MRIKVTPGRGDAAPGGYNGQLLADIQGNPATAVSCGGGCKAYGAAYLYVTEGPATSAPAVPH